MDARVPLGMDATEIKPDNKLPQPSDHDRDGIRAIVA